VRGHRLGRVSAPNTLNWEDAVLILPRMVHRGSSPVELSQFGLEFEWRRLMILCDTTFRHGLPRRAPFALARHSVGRVRRNRNKRLS
jgi:hypothetical protein